MKYSVEQQTGELADEGQESDMFDPLTPDMEQDDAVDKLYGNLSDGEIQVLYYYPVVNLTRTIEVGCKDGLASFIFSGAVSEEQRTFLLSVAHVRLLACLWTVPKFGKFCQISKNSKP